MAEFGQKIKVDRAQEGREVLRQAGCRYCPLVKRKKPDPPDEELEALVISEPAVFNAKTKSWSEIRSIGNASLRLNKARHVMAVECWTDYKNQSQCPSAAVEGCLGRKLDMIRRLKPKVVISVGIKQFNSIETALGLPAHGLKVHDGYPFPTRYEDHDFWHICVPPFDTKKYVQALGEKGYFAKLVDTPPKPEEGSFEGIHLVVSQEEFQEAWDNLVEKGSGFAVDIETNCLRPYRKNSKILTISFTNEFGTWVFAVDHKQRPSTANREWAFQILRAGIERKFKMIYHSASFDTEHLAKHLGDQSVIWDVDLHDIAALAFLLWPGAKSLNAICRKLLGFNLKEMSEVDRKKLEDLPVEQVMQYNGMDTKYTWKTFQILWEWLLREKMESIYRIQMETIRSVVCLQLKGLIPNLEFIHSESEKRRANSRKYRKQFSELEDVIKWEAKNFKKCNPGSTKDVFNLLNVISPTPVGDTDATTLKSIDHPVAHVLLKIRKEDRILGTYLGPFDRNARGLKPGEAGKHIHEDGLIHPLFKPFGTNTGRLSSADPNAQNQPSKGGLKYLRNIMIAASLGLLFSADYGQMEYRMIANLSEDPIMIDAILNDRDIHAYWATRFIDLFPGQFVLPDDGTPCTKDPERGILCEPMCYKCRFKEFRNKCKNAVVFPLCFGVGVAKIAGAMGIEKEDAQKISDEFWDEHKHVKKWQQKLEATMDSKGYILNAFGRRYYGPMKFNQIVNYPIQGTAGELVCRAMAKLSRIAYEEKRPWLCPIINEHDNLICDIPIDIFEQEIEVIIRAMLDMSEYRSWMKVPLLMEAETGPAWGSLTTFGSFDSSQIG